jgi:hypothetical protein
MNLHDLHARCSIMDVLATYCRGIDRLDVELLKSAYWEDASESHGIFEGPAHAFCEWIVDVLRPYFLNSVHLLGQSLVAIRGERAFCETYFTAQSEGVADGKPFFETTSGRYVDELEARSGIWRIRKRVVLVDLISRIPLGSASNEAAALNRGRRDRSDASYGLLRG